MSNLEQFYSQFGQNASYVRELFDLYLTDRALVGEKWAKIFDQLDDGVELPLNGHTNGHYVAAPLRGGGELHAAGLGIEEDVFRLVQAFRERGHLKAAINPLRSASLAPSIPSDLDPRSYRFSEEALKAQVPCNGFAGHASMELGNIIASLERTYCGSIGSEFSHLLDPAAREFLQRKIETRGTTSPYANDERREILRDLVRGELFESELHRKYVGQKRFSVQGAETLLPMLTTLCNGCRPLSVHEVIIGMAHRGRLNVLTNIVGKPIASIFNEFDDQTVATVVGAGDVKYHLGHSGKRATSNGEIKISLVPNPSHLEFVNPVLEGICRARQDLAYGRDRNSVLPVLIHGDAAFIGQGVVFETLNLMNLKGYSTGGTVHIVVNNQIGFTTTPEDSRSSVYCTDMAKGLDIPVFHVNCEDPEAACWVTQVALEFRCRFHRDVIIDLYGYRKYGHNEGDDPTFTQPQMYVEIQAKKTIATLYSEALVADNAIDSEALTTLQKEYLNEFKGADEGRSPGAAGDACAAHGRCWGKEPITAVSKDVLQKLGREMVTYPEGFTPHAKLHKILEKRLESLTTGAGIEWGLAEGLAFGSLLNEGYNVRVSGQDCGRGTFSQRHLALADASGRSRYVPFEKNATGATFEIINSSLSENGVLGFEFGYASIADRTLTIWEAQFGDFANGAQVIIDQFISSSESKWTQRSGVVMLLPHGFEGQGPEHSSARFERYLQLCAEGNMSVCSPTTAAQHFHLLRRQVIRGANRPLVVMTPKSLLRHPGAASALNDLVSGSFHRVIASKYNAGSSTKSAVTVLLTGKVFYDVDTLLQKRTGGKPVQVIRVEELYPFPEQEIAKIVGGAKEVLWVQEEPENMGAWGFIAPRLQKLGLTPKYIGRPEAASPATGSGKHHAKELAQFLEQLSAAIG